MGNELTQRPADEVTVVSGPSRAQVPDANPLCKCEICNGREAMLYNFPESDVVVVQCPCGLRANFATGIPIAVAKWEAVNRQLRHGKHWGSLLADVAMFLRDPLRRQVIGQVVQSYNGSAMGSKDVDLEGLEENERSGISGMIDAFISVYRKEREQREHAENRSQEKTRKLGDYQRSPTQEQAFEENRSLREVVRNQQRDINNKEEELRDLRRKLREARRASTVVDVPATVLIEGPKKKEKKPKPGFLQRFLKSMGLDADADS